MNRNRRFACVLGAAAILLWSWPFARAVAFYRESCGYLAETSSSDAARDVDFSLDLLHSYTYSLAAAFVVAWCIAKGRRTPFLLPPAFIVLFAAFEVLRLHPEEPIVLIPSMRPYRPAIISLVALVVAVAVRSLPPTRSSATRGKKRCS
jgi:hypothetical protein